MEPMFKAVGKQVLTNTNQHVCDAATEQFANTITEALNRFGTDLYYANYGICGG